MSLFDVTSQTELNNSFDISIFEIDKEKQLINLTKICQHFDRRIAKWKELPTTQRFLEAFFAKNPESENWVVVNGGNSGNGTWASRRVALKLAEWISVDFEIWCNEKLDELFQKGTVSLNQAFNIPKNYGEALLEAGRIQIRLDESLLQLEYQKPKVELADNYLTNGGNMNLTTTAKALGIAVGELGSYLDNNNIIYYTRGCKLPYSQYANWFFCKPFVARNGHSGIQLLITPKGFEMLTRRLKKPKPKTINQLLQNY